MKGWRARLGGTPQDAQLPSFESYALASDEEQRRDLHSRSTAIPSPAIRTVLVDVAGETERGFWDEPLWLPVGAILEGGDDLWEVVSVRLFLPTVTPDDPRRPLLYLYARKVEA